MPHLALFSFYAVLILSSPSARALRSSVVFAEEIQKSMSNMSKWHTCHRIITSNMPLKQYHFETTLRCSGAACKALGYVDDGEAHAAVELGREVLSPYLQIYVGYVWLLQPSPTASMFGATANFLSVANSMLWIPSLYGASNPREHLAQKPTLEIELAKQVDHVHYSSSPEELTIQLTDGTRLTFSDNKYLPQMLYQREFARRLQLVAAKHNDWMPTNSFTTNLQGAALNPGMPSGSPQGAALDQGLPPGSAKSAVLNSGIPSDLASGLPLGSAQVHQGANAYHAMNHGILKSKQYFDKAAWTSDKVNKSEIAYHKDKLMNEVLLSQLVWLVPFYGQVFLGPAMAISGIHTVRKWNRETSISGNIKIFEKLRCHPLFQSCSFPSKSTTTLALKYGQCPPSK